MTSTEAVLIGIDLGTSSCKVAAYDAAGRLLAHSRQALPTAILPDGGAEQSIDDWWQSVINQLQALRRRKLIRVGQVVAVGVCGHWPSTVLLDATGSALRRAMIWLDTRCELPASFTAEALARRVGLPSGYIRNLPVTKLGWLRQHEPQLLASGRLRWCLGTKDTLTYRLTGRAGTDRVEAWWTGLAQANGTAWDAALARAVGLSHDCLPSILPMEASLGTITPAAQAATGLPLESLVAVGTGDGYCGLIGAGTEEKAAVIVGSSIIIGAHVPQGRRLPADLPLLRFPPLRPDWDVWYASIAPGSISTLVTVATGIKVSAQAEEAALQMSLPASAPLFLPNRSSPAGLMLKPGVAVSAATDAIVLYRAALQAVVFGIRYLLAAMLEPQREAEAVGLSGGGASNPSVGQLYANDLGRPVVQRAGTEIGCLGAAMLAAAAAGIWPDLAQASAALTQPAARIQLPDPTVQVPTEERYREFVKALTEHSGTLPIPGLT